MWTFDDTQALCKANGYENYECYIHSGHWYHLKQTAGIHRNSVCCVCQNTGKTLAHHIRYRNLLDVLPGDLVPMCDDCHEEFHIACQKHGGYVDKEIPAIIEITKAFQVSKKGAERRKRIDERRAKPKQQKTKRFKKQHRIIRDKPWPNEYKKFKNRIKNEFMRFTKGSVTPETTAAFCKWLTDQVNARCNPIRPKPVLIPNTFAGKLAACGISFDKLQEGLDKACKQTPELTVSNKQPYLHQVIRKDNEPF